MKRQEHYSVPLIWTGPTKSKFDMNPLLHGLTHNRIKDKLKSGELLVRGDQWPIFLYRDSSYNPEDPWDGLLHSSLLVCVSFLHYSFSFLHIEFGNFH